MRARLFIVFSLLVLLPLGAVAALVVQMQGDERAMATVELSRVFEGRLADLDGSIARTTEAIERELTKTLEAATDARRAAVRKAPLVRQMFVLAPDGRMTFPPRDDTASEEERDFVERTRPIWEQRAILYDRPAPDDDQRATGRGTRGDSLLTLAEHNERGWVTWYWREGLHLLYWRRADDGGVVGVEVERIALLARIVGQLPDVELDRGRIVLEDSRQDPVYQWGAYEPAPDEAPFAARTLAYPLDAWRLAFYLSSDRHEELVGARAGSSSFALGFGGLAVALVLMAIYFYRESARELREAAARVGFVTQVSHELKTPLANIRLYAELLQSRLEEDDPESTERLGVIVAESHRLTRLINNILTYARQRRRAHAMDPRPVVVDDVVRSVLEQFQPALAHKAIEPSFAAGAPDPIEADADAVGQILANLVSNVEKYAPSGATLDITSVQSDDEVIVAVADDGPGIPAGARERIFQPFFRVSSRLSDGVTGTGIGLSIARELARQHGGDLELVPSERGARFALRLPTHAKKEQR